MRIAAVVVIAVAVLSLSSGCTVEIADSGDDTGTTTAASGSGGATGLPEGIAGAWTPVTLDGGEVGAKAAELGTWEFEQSVLLWATSDAACEQPFTLRNVSPDGSTATLGRAGTAKWSGFLAELPEAPGCPFGFNMPAEIVLDGDTLTITEGSYAPPDSGGTDHAPKVIEFSRGS